MGAPLHLSLASSTADADVGQAQAEQCEQSRAPESPIRLETDGSVTGGDPVTADVTLINCP